MELTPHDPIDLLRFARDTEDTALTAALLNAFSCSRSLSRRAMLALIGARAPSPVQRLAARTTDALVVLLGLDRAD